MAYGNELEISERLALNAAIEQLIETHGSDEAARQMVFAFGRTLPDTSRISGSLTTQSPGDTFTGHTSQGADVEIEDENSQVKTVSFGSESGGRIGSYKLSRVKSRKGKFAIFIAHFWKLDEGTQSEAEEPETWRLECNDSGPIWFAQRGTKNVLNLGPLRLRRSYDVENWGPSPGQRHPAGWIVEALL